MKKILEKLKNFPENLLIFVIFILLATFIYKNFFESINYNTEQISVILDFLTLILLIFYTFFTRKIAVATEYALTENIRPTVSCVLRSSSTLYSALDIKLNPHLQFDTRCIVKNHSKYNIEVFVNLNLRINGEAKTHSDAYDGKRAWPITSFQSINGHFNLFSKLNHLIDVKEVTIDLEVSYKNEMGKLYKNPTQYWHLDLEEQKWVNDIGVRA